MERRIGTITIVIYHLSSVFEVQKILSNFHEIILARQGLNFKDENLHVITLIVEGTVDQFNSLTGKLGRLPGVEARSHSIVIKTDKI
ncbi:MAG: hypothetical protein N2Z72_01720 [Bacteroidales bacterium]|nr:hypothetical protein [Bacteroidales bacterium]